MVLLQLPVGARGPAPVQVSGQDVRVNLVLAPPPVENVEPPPPVVPEQKEPKQTIEPIEAPPVATPLRTATAPQGAPDLEPGYWDHVRRRIQSNLAYPLSAKRRRQEGAATVRIELDGRGNLLSTEVVKADGPPVLARAALAAVRKAAPFPPAAEPVAGWPRLTAELPVRFRLAQ